MNGELFIGAQELVHKDQLVLRSLVKMLDGGLDAHLRFSDDLAACDVVFVPGHWPHRLLAPRIAVRVVDEHATIAPLTVPGELSVASPLRMSNVMSVLQMVVQRTRSHRPCNPTLGLHALFFALAVPLQTDERRRAVLPLSTGQPLVVDFTGVRVHTATPLEALLGGCYTVGEARRVGAVDEELIRALPTINLRQLLWALAQQLAERQAHGPQRPGCYRLQRWPDAAGLVRPGHPRLAALLTSRAMSVEQLCLNSQVDGSTVRWFVEACLALRLAVDVEPTATPVAPIAATPAVPAPPGLLGRLRDRLKLW